MDLLTRINRVAFLGPEFLTWLWFRIETEGESFEVDGASETVEVWFDDRLVVGSTMVNAQENHFRGGHPPTSIEARAALRLGKLATEARLRFIQGSREWSIVLKATDLTYGGVKIPAVLSKDDEERFYERMYLLEELDCMLSGIFGQFVKARISPSWETHLLPAIKTWVGQGVMVESPSSSADKKSQRVEATDVPPEVSPRNPDLPPWEDPVGTPNK
jgi:hypothetical protein